jgi:hypothetical protein
MHRKKSIDPQMSMVNITETYPVARVPIGMEFVGSGHSVCETQNLSQCIDAYRSTDVYVLQTETHLVARVPIRLGILWSGHPVHEAQNLSQCIDVYRPL